MSKDFDKISEQINQLHKLIISTDKKLSKQISDLDDTLLKINENIAYTLQRIQEFQDGIEYNTEDIDDDEEEDETWDPYEDYQPEDYENYDDQE